MKKLNTICFLLFSLYTLYGQNTKEKEIVIGRIDSINSNILNEQRKIWVYVPDGNTNEIFENKKEKYPVVYLLDGDTHFYSVVGMIRQLSSSNGNTICPKMIVVGIPNTNRTRDLTPTKGVVNPPFVNESMVSNSGGGKNFSSFIEKELKPYINSKYPTNPYSMFVGHSFGGLTVMNTLIEKPELFDSYISIDPSMWWNNKRLLNKIRQTKIDEKYKNKSLFLGIANTMGKGMDTIRVKKDTTFATRHIRSILELNEVLNNKKSKQLFFKSNYYKNDDHKSVPLIAEYDALRFIFSFYHLKFDLKDYEKSTILEEIKSHYNLVSEKFGSKITPEEGYINGLGYYYMSLKQFEKAEAFFKLNVNNYPKSFNVYDSIGDLYLAMENKKQAIKNFRKSVSLNKDSISKSKLEQLLNK